jgi:glucosamine 6-phosphate synthetase-like amidotransferase/phosphosugar isomerase protein
VRHSMCGIVCYFGQAEGVTRVLEALRLLEYRAPDSAGLAALAGKDGDLIVRRSVGSTRHLVATMASHPLYPTEAESREEAAKMLAKQGSSRDLESLRDCSPAAGHTLYHLYDAGGLHVGVGDRGSLRATRQVETATEFSAPLRHVLEANNALLSPDFDQDPVRHAFRLVTAHIASRAVCDQAVRDTLDRRLLVRVPAGTYANWRDAWEEEVTANTPGQAFAVAVRYFQETFPGLSDYLNKDEWERVGRLTALAMAQIILGHGRWAMVGAVTEANAHPLVDRSQTRAICENGSHNASLLLRARAEQETWWWDRGVPPDQSVHRSENTTEVLVYEWERAYHQLQEGGLEDAEEQFLAQLNAWEQTEPSIDDDSGAAPRVALGVEEQALRLALWRLKTGNTHACAFFSRREPGVLYISSHRKPIAIAMRNIQLDAETVRHELMVASDVNAALMLWPGSEIDDAADRIYSLQRDIAKGRVNRTEARQEMETLLDRFTVDVIFLDADLYQGQELLARIFNRVKDGQVVPEIRISRYDGTPITVASQQVRLNPVMVGRRGYNTYTECHIAEIPDILDDLVEAYVDQGQVHLDSLWRDGIPFRLGLNTVNLSQQFGHQLQQLRRLLLIGEGSSWRDAQAAAPLFRELLPGVVVNVYRPVEVLNVGQTVNPASDLAVQISWSGTTDSLLKVDDLLAELSVIRLSVTGRPQSDLGRRTARSAGTLDVRSGVEVSVVTVKGYAAILACLDLLALQLARIKGRTRQAETLARLTDELTLILPQHVRTVVEDQERRERIRKVAERYRDFNKVAVIGGSPADVEGELKIEEMAQIVANMFEFHDASLRSLIERTAVVDDDGQRTLFIINATTPDQQREAQPIVNYLNALEISFIIHTTPHTDLPAWEAISSARVFLSPQVSDLFQPLIDVIFFFDLALALAYARGLSPEAIDRPRNLAKSVTTTGAERRTEVEIRHDLRNVTLADFGSGHLTNLAWDAAKAKPSRAALRATVALRAALVTLSEPAPEILALSRHQHIIVTTDTEATENAAQMSAVAWQDLLGIDLTTYRRFISDSPQVPPGTALIRLIRAGAVFTIRDSHTLALPSDLSPAQLEMLAATYLTGLAVRLARQGGTDTSLWEVGLAQLPLVITEVLNNADLGRQASAVLSPFIDADYDKIQIVGGGQDHISAQSIARSFRMRGFMAEALYTDSAWHGPLATVGGPDADHDTLILILATDPLFQAAALVDTQVYRARNARVILVVPDGNQSLPVVRGVDPSAVLAVPAVARPFLPMVNAALGTVLAQEMARLWEQKDRGNG